MGLSSVSNVVTILQKNIYWLLFLCCQILLVRYRENRNLIYRLRCSITLQPTRVLSFVSLLGDVLLLLPTILLLLRLKVDRMAPKIAVRWFRILVFSVTCRFLLFTYIGRMKKKPTPPSGKRYYLKARFISHFHSAARMDPEINLHAMPSNLVSDKRAPHTIVHYICSAGNTVSSSALLTNPANM